MRALRAKGSSCSCAHPRRGSALAFTLIVVTGVALISAGFIRLSSSITNRQITSIDNKRAFYLAEAGLAEAYLGLVIGKSGQVGFDRWPATYGDGVFWVNAENVSPTTVRLESTGMCASGRATLSMVVESQQTSVATLGFFSEQDVTVEAFSLIDSYDSSLATYQNHVAGNLNRSSAQFGSNGDILLSEVGFGAGTGLTQTQVLGDATPGVTGTATVEPGVTVSGSIAPRTKAIALPQVQVPPLSSLAGVTHSGAIPMIIPSTQIAYDSIYLVADSTLEIRGPATVVIGTLETEARTEIIFDTAAGDIDLYVTEELEVSQSILTNTTQEPALLNVLVSAADPQAGTEAVHVGGTSFYGTIYAPNATVLFDANVAIYGAAAAKRLVLGQSADLHYDVSLLSGLSQASMPKMISWRVVSIPKASSRIRLSPFHLTGIRPEELPTPSRAHDLSDVHLTITYVNTAGSTVSYSGSEDLFDWSAVKAVISRTRNLNSEHANHDCTLHWAPAYNGQNPGSVGTGYQGTQSFGEGQSGTGGFVGI